jgi:HD-like signal output (HDOD) protein
MKKWIARLFGGSSASTDAPAPDSADAPLAPPAGTANDSSAPATAPNALPHRNDEVAAAFYRWLAGPLEHNTLPATEKLILDELLRLAQSPGSGADLVPRVPAVIPQLLRSLRDDSMSGADLSRQVAQDVVLVAEVIREANSPYYRPSAPVRTIEGAVMLLGQNGLRMLLARVAFRPVISMQTGRFARQVAPHVWVQSEKCALAANLLAQELGANPFEAYLAGLMHNVGLIVAFRLIDQIYSGDGLPQSDVFCAGLTTAVRTLSSNIALQWGFPETVAAAIAEAGRQDGADGAAAPLVQALVQGDRVATLRLLVDAGQLKADDRFVADRLEGALAECFEKLAAGDS